MPRSSFAIPVVGLTGGIATGKSTIARLFAERGRSTIDADQLARAVVAPGAPALRAIRERFGPSVFAERGALDRAALGALVFADPEARRALEAITHPRIARALEIEIEALKERGEAWAIYEAALLVETKSYERFDRLIVAAVERDTQIERLMRRDGLARDEAIARIASQAPLADKIAVADLVIRTDLSRRALAERVAEIDVELDALFGAP